MKTKRNGEKKGKRKGKQDTLLDYKSSSVMLSRCGRHTATRPRRRSLAVDAFSFMISDRYLSLASSRFFSPSAPPPAAAGPAADADAALRAGAPSRAVEWSFLLRRLLAAAAAEAWA